MLKICKFDYSENIRNWKKIKSTAHQKPYRKKAMIGPNIGMTASICNIMIDPTMDQSTKNPTSKCPKTGISEQSKKRRKSIFYGAL